MLLLPVCAVMAAVEAAVVAEAPLLVAHALHGTTGAHGGGERARCCRATAGFHDQHQNDAADSTEAPL